MIRLRNIHKSFGRQTLFEDASLQINDGERFALVGPNGSGKTTLFKMLLGETEADSGEIQISQDAAAGYLPQENAPVSDRTVLEEALSALDEPHPRKIAEAKAVLMGLGFKVADFERRVDTLSGGWAMRAAMARLLVQEPDLLMLDEPTNHLDLDSMLWLEEHLLGYQGAVFIISHDRAFINTVCSSIVSVQEKQLKSYPGNYEHYLEERRLELERQKSAWKRQQDEIAHMQDFIDRNRVRAATAARAQSMIKRLEKLERVELPVETKTVKIRFPQPSRTGLRALSLQNVCKSYPIEGQSPLKIYENLDFEIERGWKMALVGHNGAGKSTLLKLLAGVIDPDTGSRQLGLNVKTGYFSQHRTGQLDPAKTVLQEAMDNDRRLSELLTRTVLGAFLFHGDAVFKKTAVLSGGEKSRLSLVKLLLDPPNVLLMDEPTTHLDIASVDALVAALKEYEGTLVLISHDIYFMNSLADRIVHVDGGRITLYTGDYDTYLRRRRQAQEVPTRTVSPERVKQETTSDKKKSTVSDVEARKRAQRAETLKMELSDLMKQIESLAHKMSDPGIYSDYRQVRVMGDELRQLEAEAKIKEEELQKLVERE